jgi:SNF2 family DNA or RNA helicase
MQTCTKVSELVQQNLFSCPPAVQLGTSARELQQSPADSDNSQELRMQYGSKLLKVIETVQDIQAREGEATKCLIFIQWDCISVQMERGLKAAGISPLVLRGHVSQRQKAIARFVDCHEPDASVLLLSLEHSPSGMNLACAHHVLLVHPMHADRCEDAVSHELQAIGRVRRRGQKHTVHVYRFVANGTVEEALTKQHRDLCQHQQQPSGAD